MGGRETNAQPIYHPNILLDKGEEKWDKSIYITDK